MTARHEDEIAAGQIAALLQRLDQANHRISELDLELRKTHAEVDTFRRESVARLRTAHSLSSAHSVFPAFGVGRILDGTSTAERRKVWLDAMQELAVETGLQDVYPHGGGSDPLALLVRGSGGYGDMLYLAMFVRGLHRTFPDAQIHVVHEHPGVASIFEANPYVTSATQLEGSRGHEFLLLATLMDCFDLVADVRYAITYCAPPKSRIDPVWLAQANLRTMPWQSFVRDDWPYLNNQFAKKIVAQGHSKYSFVAHTGNVDTAAGNWGDFFGIEPWSKFAKQPYAAQLARAYVTIHHGADRFMADANGMQTKNLPLSTWETVVALLDRQGIATVQLGEAHETAVPGVTVDLRGETLFPQTAQVIRFAQCHIDTEGGLVHLARAVGTRAVVAFGPTAERFFGYPENFNIAAAECGDCWWTTTDWAVRCPRDLPDVPCMASHQAADLVKAALPSVKQRTDIALSVAKAGEESTVEFLTSKATTKAATVLVAADNGQVLDHLAACHPSSARLHLFALTEGAGRPRRSSGNAISPAIWDRIPSENGLFDTAVIGLTSATAADIATLAFELARALKNGGTAFVQIAKPSRALAGETLAKAIAGLPGQRLGSVQVEADSADAGGQAVVIRLRFTAATSTDRKISSGTAASLGKRVRALVKR